MKKESNNRFVLLIIAIILLGFSSVSMLNYFTGNKIVDEDSKNITKLTAITIYAEIQNELTKPIFVGLTMANDSFVKSWLENETKEDVDLIVNYLNGIKNKYGYSSAFLVSGKTGKYYHTNGVLKVISKEDEHDVWYFNFLDSKKEYDLDVDTDQANYDKVSIFINSEIKSSTKSDGSVIGVGLEIKEIKEILEEYNESLGLNIMLIDIDGIVQVSTDESAIEKLNYFSKFNDNDIKESILAEKEGYKLIESNDSYVDNYIFSKYIEDLDWYLIVENDTEIVKSILIKQQFVSFVVIGFVIIFVTVVIAFLIRRYQKNILYMATRDPLTGLMNRRAMESKLSNYYNDHKRSGKPLCLYIFDIDDFKKINDIYGHTIGDDVLNRVAQLALKIFGEDSISRLGGDEFTGALFMNSKEASNIMNKFRLEIEEDPMLSSYKLTVSIGISELENNLSIEKLMYRADQAMYKAKEDGKNKVSF